VSAARSGVLVVFAKAPRPGRVKTRMCPPLSPVEAAEFYAAMLADVLEASAVVAAQLDLEPVLAAHPPEALGELARRAPPPYRVVPQRGGDLGQRMDCAVREAAAGGARRILLRGSDSPGLEPSRVAAALADLEECDVALSPDRDGGYNLIGLRAPAPGLFAHPLSTGAVLEDTLAAAAGLGLRARVQEPAFDLDVLADLRWLAALRGSPAEAHCRRSVAWVDAKGLWGAADSLAGV
jgi:rSAM/selenodomain-associated transferase 1